jgi:flavin-dependent dehydrogenase
MRTVDVAIAGGGPSGLATALSLIKLDGSWRDRLVVLEKAAHPRHKLCAGGLTPYALKQLKRLRLKLTIPVVEVERLHFHYRGRVIDLRGDPAIVVTRRLEFDDWLAECARKRGVRLLENHEITVIDADDDGFEIKTNSGNLRARIIVGADGSRGIVRSWMGARENPPRVARLLEFVHRATWEDPEYRDRFARFDFTPSGNRLQGYYWDFPSVIGGEPYMNCGVFDGRVAPQRPKADLPHILKNASIQRQIDPVEFHFEGHPIHWFSPRNTFSRSRALLVGDAAGAEPLFGEGIGTALGYGEVAAEALDDAFKVGRFDFTSYRRRLLLSDVGRYLTLRWLIASVGYRWSGSDLFMRATWAFGRALAAWVGSLPSVDGVLPERDVDPSGAVSP